jgi:DNA-binding transcriptional LysR family regulator
MFVALPIRIIDMPRNLDLSALRSFVAVAETGGVTRAAGFLNLTQSAVSMQLKRLEDSLGIGLLDRTGRGIGLTSQGEQLLGYARRMLDLNDEVQTRLTARAHEGELVLGVPHDVVYPAVPQVLRRFAMEYPRMKVQLLSSFTRQLRAQFARGEADVILTTEDDLGPGGETLVTRPLVWLGAPGGRAWRQRPLRLAFETPCIFRQGIQARLDQAGIPWEMAVESDSSRTISATVSADLAVHAMIEGSHPGYFEKIDHGGTLPDLRDVKINLYRKAGANAPVLDDLVAMVRQAYQAA